MPHKLKLSSQFQMIQMTKRVIKYFIKKQNQSFEDKTSLQKLWFNIISILKEDSTPYDNEYFAKLVAGKESRKHTPICTSFIALN